MPASLIRSLGNYVRLPTKALCVTALVLASTIIVAGLALWTWSDFSEATSDGETIVSTTSLAMDDFARNSLQAVDGVLESVVARIEENGIANLGSEPEMEYLWRCARGLSKAGAIHVANDAGDIVAAVPSLWSRINVSDREWFKGLKDEKAGTHVGRTLEADKGHDHFFAVGRSIRGPDGSQPARPGERRC